MTSKPTARRRTKAKAKVFLAADGLPAPQFPRVKGRLPPLLTRCPGCGYHLFPEAKVCFHCGGNQAQLYQKQLKAHRAAQRALKVLQKLFA